MNAGIAGRSAFIKFSPAALQLTLFIAVFALLWPTTASFLLLWKDMDSRSYTHGYIIAAISVWLILRNAPHVSKLQPRPSYWIVPLIAVATVLWLVALRSGIQVVHQLLLPVIVALVWGAVQGPRVALKSSFPLAYLLFAIPIWGEINSLLQSLTVSVVELLLRITSIPAFVEGNLVHLSAGVFEIAGGCSGLHFLIIALAIAAFYGELDRDSLMTRSWLLALAAAFALTTNWLRVYVIILAGYLTDMQHYLVRVDHYRFGWVVFGLAMLGFFLVARRLPAGVDSGGGVSEGSPTRRAGAAPLVIVLSCSAVAIGPVWQALAPVSVADPARTDTLLANQVGSWRVATVNRTTDTDWSPSFAGADRTWQGQFVLDRAYVEVFTAVYAYQVQGRELVSWQNSIVDPAKMTITGRSRVPGASAMQLDLRGTDGSHSLLRYYYCIGSMCTAEDVAAQIGYGLQSLISVPISRIVAVRASCQPDCRAAEGILDSFFRELEHEGRNVERSSSHSPKDGQVS